MPSDYKLGTCRWCETEGEVFRDNSMCDDCDSNVVYCNICKCDQHYENSCRHVFQDENFEWCGSGLRWGPTDDVKESFFKLLSFMPPAFPRDLRAAIRSGNFHTWLVAPMIGGGGCLSLYGMPDRHGRFMVNNWGKRILKLGEGEHAEIMADGYRWLACLYNRDTPRANRATVKWLDEWLAPVGA